MTENMMATSTGEIERRRIIQKTMKRRWTQVTMAGRIAATNRDVWRVVMTLSHIHSKAHGTI